MNARIVSLLIAGFVGIIIGWLLSPNINDLRDDMVARLDAQTPQIAALQTGVAGIEQRLAALPSADQAVASLNQRMDALQASVAGQVDAIAARVGEQASGAQEQMRSGIEGLTGNVQERLDAMTAQVQELSASVAAMREAGPAAGAQGAGGDPAQLAEEIGATGAVLLPGQGAIFGGQRLDLVSLDAAAGTASIRAAGGSEESVEDGATIQVSETCSVRLAGVAAGAAYLAPENCAEPAAAEGEAQQGAAQAGAPAGNAEAQPAEGDAPAGGQQPAPAPAQ